MELCSDITSLDERGVWGRMDTCICMAESLHCSSETITTLLVGYTPKQNVFCVKKLKKKKKKEPWECVSKWIFHAQIPISILPLNSLTAISLRTLIRLQLS